MGQRSPLVCPRKLELVWHLPHGIDRLAALLNNSNYSLLCEQPSPAKSTILHLSLYFYYCKRFLAKYNTVCT